MEIHQKKSETAAHFRNSWTYGEQWNIAIAELTELAKECLHPGWDGYGSPAVRAETFRLAARFIETIPYNIPQPEIGASSAGDVTFDWVRSPYRVVSLGISSNGALHFAALNGQKRYHGSMPFDGTFDSDLHSLILETLG